MIKEVLTESKNNMHQAIDSLSNDLATVRTGRASTALVEKLKVKYYGTLTPLQKLAFISVPESQLIAIRPYDVAAIKDIERGIMQSNLGITPSNDGKIIRLKVPPLTEERRKSIVKSVHKRVEEARISIRNQRRDSIAYLRDLEKEKMITEDDTYLGKDKLQELTDEYIEKADKIGDAKESEIMSI